MINPEFHPGGILHSLKLAPGRVLLIRDRVICSFMCLHYRRAADKEKFERYPQSFRKTLEVAYWVLRSLPAHSQDALEASRGMLTMEELDDPDNMAGLVIMCCFVTPFKLAVARAHDQSLPEAERLEKVERPVLCGGLPDPLRAFVMRAEAFQRP